MDTQAAGQPRLEVSDIFRHFQPWLKDLPKSEAKVVSDITNCRTSVLGGHKLACDNCDHQEYSYNSCRNRHCPKCQFLTKSRWVEERNSELLPVEYFHVVFTIPHELNDVIWNNKKIGYSVLFRAMSETLKEVAEKRLKAKIGFTAVLHTWSQTLNRHAHIHAVVPGGGISLDGKKWISCKQGYFLPLKVLSKVFRGKFLEYFEESFSKLSFESATAHLKNPTQFKSLLVLTAKKEWVVYAKAPFAGPKQVLEYLGNYTHRIAISNYRIENINGDQVTFKYKDRADENKSKLLSLPGTEFIKRFLSHVLPPKFVRIRHFGFLGSKNKKKNIKAARDLLGAKHIEKVKDADYKALLKRLTGHDIDQCPCCRIGKLVKTESFSLHPSLQRKNRKDSS
ncbi:MAG: IS91 family transposase [Pseudobdellovibrionaceae bacterium]